MASILQQARGGEVSKFAKEVIGIIKILQKNNAYARVKGRVRVPELENIIQKYTKSDNFQVIVDGGLRRNAWALPPRLTKNNPMFYDMWRHVWPEELEEEGYAVVRRNKHPIGYVDQDGIFNGFFRKLPCEIGLSWDMLTPTGDIRHTPEEVAATLFHEIGHIVVALRMLDHTARINQVLNAAHTAMMDIGDTKRRVVFLQELEKEEGIEIPDLEYVARENKKELTTTVLLGASIRAFRNEIGDDCYNLRGFESLADHYATQHGLGYHLATGLDKLHTGSAAKYKSAGQATMVVLEGIFAIYASVMSIGLLPLLIIAGLVNPSEKIYDDPKDRMARTRRQLIEHLKSAKDKDERNKLIKQIDELAVMMEEYHNKRGVLEAIFETVSPKGREVKKARDLNQVLEKLASNELFVAADRLKQFA